MNLNQSNEDRVQERSLFKRFQLNALGYGYAQVLTLAMQLLLVPFFLKFWGTTLYADWLVLTGVPTMLTLLDLGISQAIANRATMEVSAGRWEDARASLQTAFAFTGVTCLVIAVSASAFAQSVDWVNLLELHEIRQADAATVMFVMCAYLCVGLMGGPLDAWLRSIGRAASGAFLLANRRLIDLLISVFVLTSGGGVVALCVALLIGQMTAISLLYVVAAKWSPLKIFGVNYSSRKVFLETLRPALAYMGIPVAQIVTLQGGLQVLNQIASPSLVVVFTMSRTLMRLVMQIGVVANSALKPEISWLAGQGRLVKAHKFSRHAGYFVLLICSATYAILVLCGPLIITWWGNGAVESRHFDLLLIGAHALINVAWFIPASSLIATNRHIALSVTYGVASLTSLACWFALRTHAPAVLGASLMMLAPELVVLSFVLLRNEQRQNHEGLP